MRDSAWRLNQKDDQVHFAESFWKMKNFAVKGDEAALSVTSALSSGRHCAGAARARNCAGERLAKSAPGFVLSC